MKYYRLFFIIGILFIFYSFAIANDTIDVYYKNKKIGSFTVQEFTELINASEWAKEIKEAQNNNQVKVYITQYIPVDVQQKKYKAYITVEWYNTKKEKINYMLLETIINIDNETIQNMSDVRILYRDIAEVSVPILMLLCIIFAIL